MTNKLGFIADRTTSAITTRLNSIRYYLYRCLDFRANKNHFSIFLVISLFYNALYFLIPITAIVPMIVNYVTLEGTTDWNTIVPINSDLYHRFTQFNHDLGIYFFVEYILLYFMLADFFIRWIVVDYKYSNVLVRNHWKYFLKYPFTLANFYEIASFIILIVLYANYGTLGHDTYTINIGAFNTNVFEPDKTGIQQQMAQSWLKAQMVFVALFFAMIVTTFPRTISGYKNTKNNNLTLKAFLLKKIKVPLIATVFLIILLLIFSFVILKSEQSYYSSHGIKPPASSPTDFGQAMWYCFITITTVGYGQYIPQSPPGRWVAIFLIIIGVSYYSFYGVFFISIYTSFIQRKQLNDEAKQQALQEEKKQTQLAQKIKNELVQELLKYNVIDLQKYNEVQAQESQYSKMLMQSTVNAANQAAVNLSLYNYSTLLLRFVGWFKKKEITNYSHGSDLAIISGFANDDIYLQNDWLVQNKQDVLDSVIYVFKRNYVRQIYNSNQKIVVSKIGPLSSKNVKRLLVYLPEPYDKCYGELIISEYDILSAEGVWKKFGTQTGFSTEQEFLTEYKHKNALHVYVIDKKVIFTKFIQIKGVQADPSKLKYFVLFK